jgi:uncharacterized BrkB/YihY/UPF0761 family membrane protein
VCPGPPASHGQALSRIQVVIHDEDAFARHRPERPYGVDFWHVVSEVVSVVIITLLFALIYKVLPDAKIKWTNV